MRPLRGKKYAATLRNDCTMALLGALPCFNCGNIYPLPKFDSREPTGYRNRRHEDVHPRCLRHDPKNEWMSVLILIKTNKSNHYWTITCCRISNVAANCQQHGAASKGHKFIKSPSIILQILAITLGDAKLFSNLMGELIRFNHFKTFEL